MSRQKYGTFERKTSRDSEYTLYGLSTDAELLPTDDDTFSSGDSAYCVDTGDVYIFLKATMTWYKQ